MSNLLYSTYDSEWDVLQLLGSLPMDNMVHIPPSSIESSFVQEYHNDVVQPTGSYFQPALSPRSFSTNPRPGTQQMVNGTKPKKPLNSYMAFRSFYSPLFTQQTQMAASPFLKRLWEKEPFKPRWAIIGRAYTAVRDVSSKQALPLSVFLRTAAPLMGIIPVTNYLAMMGWEISHTSNGTVELNHVADSNPRTFPPDIRNTAMTEHDLIRHSWKASFSSEMVSDALSLLRTRRPQQALLAVTDCTSHMSSTIAPQDQDHQQRRRKAKQKRKPKKACSSASTLEDATGLATEPYQIPWSGCMADLRLPTEQSAAALDSQYLNNDFLGFPRIEQSGLFELDSFFTETWSPANSHLA